VISSPAQTFTKLVDFNGSNGTYPQFLDLIQGTDGNFYGTTTEGGTSGQGTIFKITAAGELTTLHNFDTSDGASPHGTLVQTSDGNFYGTTQLGGAYGYGTVFRMTPGGTVTSIHSFDISEGNQPFDGLVQADDGNLYGTTDIGGSQDAGTVFRITLGGALTTLHSFRQTDGSSPIGGLVQARDGNFYGTTQFGGAHSSGTLYKITRKGTLTTVHDFNQTDGTDPFGVLLQATDGSLYGTTAGGGTYDSGTVFKFIPGGTLTTLYSFCAENGCADGAYPVGALIQATDGNFYGTTTSLLHDRYSHGTVFSITPGGVLTTLHDFDIEDGAAPHGGLVQATSGKFYGTTYSGGADDLGTIFSLDAGLTPFVTFARDSGKVGQTGGILGQGFTGTTSVSLNGTPARFKVISDTFLKATVPAGARSGPVIVITPSATLTSNKIFRVTPQLLSFDPPNGPVGTQVTITGVSLAQTLDVGFGNRSPAQFTVNSDKQVMAIVPAGANTGKIGIETKGGIAISAGTFTVTQ
jgi:uncharacterized repeat protein (TIGR03803 family)